MEQNIEPVDFNEQFSFDDIDCPICGNRAITRFFFETAEEQIDCYSCGYTRKFYITNLDSKDDTSQEFEWTPAYSIEEKQGYGAYSVRMLNSDNIEVGSFATEQSEQFFIDTIEQMKDQVAYAKYSKLVDGKIEEVILISTVE